MPKSTVDADDDISAISEQSSSQPSIMSTKDHHFHDRARARSEQVTMISEDFPSTSRGSAKRRFMKRRKWRRFKRFLYNKDNRTFCHRTYTSWLAVCGYYLIFIILVLAVFLALLIGCIIFLKSNEKPWMSKKNLIEDNIPGISYYPNIDYLSESLIWYKVDKQDPAGRASEYVEQIEEYYNKLERICARDPHYKCNFNRSAMGPCGAVGFGYDTKSPCILVRLNKMQDWIPQGYPDDNIPKYIPQDLRQQIKDTKEVRLWIDCRGLDIYDRDYVNKVEYYPIPGYPSSGFPYTDSNRAYYVSPLVAIHLSNMDSGRVLCLKCQLYAKNYYQESHFEQLTKTYIYVEI